MIDAPPPISSILAPTLWRLLEWKDEARKRNVMTLRLTLFETASFQAGILRAAAQGTARLIVRLSLSVYRHKYMLDVQLRNFKEAKTRSLAVSRRWCDLRIECWYCVLHGHCILSRADGYQARYDLVGARYTSVM